MDQARLFQLLPHRPPMVWIDQVLSSDEKGGSGLVIFNPDSAYCSHKKLRSTALIEMMAQVYGLVMLYQYLLVDETTTIKRAFLASIRNFEFDQELLQQIKAGDKIEISVEQTHALGSLILINGKACISDNQVATAKLKLFAEV